METLGTIIMAVVMVVVAIFATGCSGTGISSKVEWYSIDDRLQTESVKTSGRPAICYFKDCNKTEYKGS